MDSAVIQECSQKETFEQFMASLKELREQMKETDRKMQETDRQMKETDQQIKETDQQIKETGWQMKETDRQMKEAKKIVMETSRRMGDLGNNFGALAENLVAPNLVTKFKKLGYDVDKTSRDIEIQNVDNPNMLTEIDILLENGDIAIVVEVKSKLRDKHLEEFLVKMEKVRWHADLRQDKREYIGAIAAVISNNEQRLKILNEGIYVIEPSGATMKVNSPKGFIPRKW